MQMAVSCKIQQLDDGYWSSVIIGLGGEHCEHSAPRIIVACCVCVCVCPVPGGQLLKCCGCHTLSTQRLFRTKRN